MTVDRRLPSNIPHSGRHRRPTGCSKADPDVVEANLDAAVMSAFNLAEVASVLADRGVPGTDIRIAVAALDITTSRSTRTERCERVCCEAPSDRPCVFVSGQRLRRC